MEVRDKVALITGGAGGIGAALARRFAAEGAAGVAVCDLDGDGVRALAGELSASGTPALGLTADVRDESQVDDIVARARKSLGPIDLMCSNAGVASGKGLEDATHGDWADAWSINVMAHVHAARAVIPSMVKRGGGYLLHTCSAAGVLSNPGDVPYTASKHAAVGLAEWLAFTYRNSGIKVSAVCPQGVRTPMLMNGLAAGGDAAQAVAAGGQLIGPEQVADTVVDGMAAERFLILPHSEVGDYQRHKTENPDRWLAGMSRLATRATALTERGEAPHHG